MAYCAVCLRPVLTKIVVLEDGTLCHEGCRHMPRLRELRHEEPPDREEEEPPRSTEDPTSG